MQATFSVSNEKLDERNKATLNHNCVWRCMYTQWVVQLLLSCCHYSTLIHNCVCTCDPPACSRVHSIPPLRTIIYSKSSLLGTAVPIREHCWENTLVMLRWAILQHLVSTQSLSHVTVASYSHSFHVASLPCNDTPFLCHTVSFLYHCGLISARLSVAILKSSCS